MGFIGATFKAASKINDTVPFTPQTKTIYDTASKFDLFNLLPGFPETQVLENDTDYDPSKTLVNGNGSVANGNSEKVSKIKERLILSRRIRIAINEQDKDFNVGNIMRHDDSLFKNDIVPPAFNSGSPTPLNGSRNLLPDYSDYEVSEHEISFDNGFEESVEDALNSLNKSLTNDRIKYDDALFDRFFSSSITRIVNSVYRNRPGYDFNSVLESLDKEFKFHILRTYLNDDQLVTDFKSKVQHRATDINRAFGGSTPVKTKRPIQRQMSKRGAKSHTRDQLMLKTIQLMIAISYKFFTFTISVLFPLIQLIWFSFLELNDHFQLVNTISDVLVSFFALLIDQIFAFIDNGETFEPENTPQRQRQEGIFKNTNNTYFKILRTLLTDKLSKVVALSDRYKYGAQPDLYRNSRVPLT